MTTLSTTDAERLKVAFQRCRDMEGTLNEQLRAYAEAGRDIFPAYGEAVDRLALLWQSLSCAGFPNQFFCDSWVVGLWRGRPWEAGDRIGGRSLDAFWSRFWIDWVTRLGDRCAQPMWRD